MSVRCKFKVDAIETTLQSQAKRDDAGSPVKDEKGNYVYERCEMATIKLSPVYGNNDPKHENSKFWAASPSGSFQLGTVNKSAVAQLELGAEYYIDITKAG